MASESRILVVSGDDGGFWFYVCFVYLSLSFP